MEDLSRLNKATQRHKRSRRFWGKKLLSKPDSIRANRMLNHHTEIIRGLKERRNQEHELMNSIYHFDDIDFSDIDIVDEKLFILIRIED